MEEKEKQLKKLEKTNIILLIVCIIMLVVSIFFITRTCEYMEPHSGSCSDPDEDAKEMFNEPFMANLGDVASGGISAQQAKVLISEVRASNGKNADRQITLEGITKISKISNKLHYSAIEEYDDEGYINKITITEIQNSSKGD